MLPATCKSPVTGNGEIKCVCFHLLHPAFLLSFSWTSCLGIPAADTHPWPPHPPPFPPRPWLGILFLDSFISFIWLYPTSSDPTLTMNQPLFGRGSPASLVWGAQPSGPAWPQFPAGHGGWKGGVCSHQRFQFVQTAFEVLFWLKPGRDARAHL